jgi:predicted dehydrogenase
MGSTHARAFRAVTNDEVTAIYAPSPERAQPLADEVGALYVTSIDEVMGNPAIDAVDICLPTPWHRSAAEQALAAGKHVLLEKPVALTLEDADALIALAETSDRVVMMAHVLRFWPEYVALQTQVSSGNYGKPVSALAYRRQAYPAWSTLFSQVDLTGGAVIDMMIHDFDAVNWVLGTPISVAARGLRNPTSGGIDQVQVLIEYEGGASALVDGGMMMPETYPFTSSLQVLCERGAAEYHFQAGGRSVEEGTGVNTLTYYPTEGSPEVIVCEPVDPYHAEIAYFDACVQNNAPAARATLSDAKLALQVALAARESIESPGLTVVAL